MTAGTDVDGRRDDRGRFGPGNRFGAGNPHHMRLLALRQAAREAVDAVTLQQVLRGLADAASKGDAAAGRVLLEFVLGRPRQQEPDVRLDLGPLEDAQDFARAFAALAKATAAGDVPPDVAAHLGHVLGRAHDVTVVAQLEERIRAIEEDHQ